MVQFLSPWLVRQIIHFLFDTRASRCAKTRSHQARCLHALETSAVPWIWFPVFVHVPRWSHWTHPLNWERRKWRHQPRNALSRPCLWTRDVIYSFYHLFNKISKPRRCSYRNWRGLTVIWLCPIEDDASGVKNVGIDFDGIVELDSIGGFVFGAMSRDTLVGFCLR